jgi:hypothetical protein
MSSISNAYPFSHPNQSRRIRLAYRELTKTMKNNAALLKTAQYRIEISSIFYEVHMMLFLSYWELNVCVDDRLISYNLRFFRVDFDRRAGLLVTVLGNPFT